VGEKNIEWNPPEGKVSRRDQEIDRDNKRNSRGSEKLSSHTKDVGKGFKYSKWHTVAWLVCQGKVAKARRPGESENL